MPGLPHPLPTQFVSGASMRAPEEVFASEAGGAPRAEEELEREDRKRRRAQVGTQGSWGWLGTRAVAPPLPRDPLRRFKKHVEAVT